jgi:hypothetical protein
LVVLEIKNINYRKKKYMMYCVLYNNAVRPFKCEGWHFTNMWKAFA